MWYSAVKGRGGVVLSVKSLHCSVSSPDRDCTAVFRRWNSWWTGEGWPGCWESRRSLRSLWLVSPEAAGRLCPLRVLPEHALPHAVPGPLRQGPGHKEAPLCLQEGRRFILCGQAPQGRPQMSRFVFSLIGFMYFPFPSNKYPIK